MAFAQREAVARGSARFLTLPGDVPCVTAEEIARAMRRPRRRPPASSSCPRARAQGTNAALLAPPDAMPLTFGEPSFENHLKTARARGLAPHVLELPGIGLDVDAPDDLRRPPRARPRHAERAGSCAASRGAHSVRRGSLAMPPRYEVIGVEGLPEFRAGRRRRRL